MIETIMSKYKISMGDNIPNKNPRQAMYSHFHKEIEIIYILDGECNATLDGENYHMNTGDTIIFPSGSIHSATATPYSQTILLIFKDDILETYNLKNRLLRGLITKEQQKQSGIDKHLRYIFEEFASMKQTREFETGTVLYAFRTDKYSDIVNQLNILKLWTLLLSDFEAEALKETGNDRIYEILQYIDGNFITEEITLSSIAARLNYSTAYTSRLFKKTVGMNFKKYILSLKIKRACNLLIGTDMGINRISEECGFESVRTFNETFKKILKVTPNEFRKRTFLSDDELARNAMLAPYLKKSAKD